MPHPYRRAAWMATMALGLFVAAAPVQSADQFSPDQVKAIEKLVRDYIMSHPEIVTEALQEAERREEERRVAHTRAVLKAQNKQLRHDPNSYVAGNPDGDVTIVEFFDYRCTYCKQVMPELLKAMKADNGVRIVFKELPILGPDSLLASQAAIAAMQQRDKYFDFHTALMGARGSLTREVIMDIAEEVGLDTEKLARDMVAPGVNQVIQDNHKLAQALQIRGTPSLVIGDHVIRNGIPFQQIQAYARVARSSCTTC